MSKPSCSGRTWSSSNRTTNVSTVLKSGYFRVRNWSPSLWKCKDIWKLLLSRTHKSLLWEDCDTTISANSLIWYWRLQSWKGQIWEAVRTWICHSQCSREIWLWSRGCETTSRRFECRNKLQKWFILKSKRIYFSLTKRAAFGIEFFFRHITRENENDLSLNKSSKHNRELSHFTILRIHVRS